MKSLLLLSLTLFLSPFLHAQDFGFGKLTERDLRISKDSIDNFSNAVVLNEYGRAHLEYNKAENMNFVEFYYHGKIKIFNHEGHNNANIVIPMYKTGNTTDRLYSLEAYTYNTEDGKIKKIKVDSKSVYTEEYNKGITLTKFTFPDLKDGSIIEYRYTKYTPRIFNFHTWEFQDDIPKLRSCFQSIIPENFHYHVNLRGYYSLTNIKKEIKPADYVIDTWSESANDITYVMENMPAFEEEDYMTAASNFKSAIYYELDNVVFQNLSSKNFTTTWDDVEKILIDDDNFGAQLKKNSVFKEAMPNIIANKSSTLEKANAIYNYIRRQIKWNKSNGIYADPSITDALKKHTGSSGDINLALTNALNHAGIPTDAFIISTRRNGTPNMFRPVLTDFNYVLARANIDGTIYYLDATEQNTAFGILPFRCLNGLGRVIPLNEKSYWDSIAPTQSGNVYYNMKAKLQTDGKLVGHIQIISSNYNAYTKKDEIKRYTSMDDYIEKSLIPSLGKIKIGNYTVDGIDSASASTVIEDYQFELKLYDSTNFNKLGLNPFLLDKRTKNPFNLNERNYPIDLGMRSSYATSIDIELPPTFTIDSKPKDIKMILPNKDAAFSNFIKLTNQHLHCEYQMSFNRVLFLPDDYPNLKEFFSRIIQLEKTDIIFKKQ